MTLVWAEAAAAARDFMMKSIGRETSASTRTRVRMTVMMLCLPDF